MAYEICSPSFIHAMWIRFEEKTQKSESGIKVNEITNCCDSGDGNKRSWSK
jgi:hypothetical protein